MKIKISEEIIIKREGVGKHSQLYIEAMGKYVIIDKKAKRDYFKLRVYMPSNPNQSIYEFGDIKDLRSAILQGFTMILDQFKKDHYFS